MAIKDPIADMLTRIRNANAKFHPEVSMPHSKMKEAIARILVAEGYIKGCEVLPHEPHSILKIQLKYHGERSHAKRAITEIRLISKSSRRTYAGKDEIPQPLGGLGMCIVSTSQGILSGSESRQRGIGGEVLCEVW
jgi:small subunit ribosomal protein S8